MLPQAVNTNHRCIWHRLAAIWGASFDWRLWAPCSGEGVVVEDWRWVARVARW